MAPNPKRPQSGEPITDEQVLQADDPRPAPALERPPGIAIFPKRFTRRSAIRAPFRGAS